MPFISSLVEVTVFVKTTNFASDLDRLFNKRRLIKKIVGNYQKCYKNYDKCLIYQKFIFLRFLLKIENVKQNVEIIAEGNG